MNNSCANCCKTRVKGEKRYPFSNLVKDRSFTVIEGLQTLFMDKLGSNFNDSNQQLCKVCAAALGTSVENIRKFNGLRQNGSFILDNLITPIPNSNPISPLRRTPKRGKKRKWNCVKVVKTPVCKKFKKYLSNKRDSQIVQNELLRNLRIEMNRLIRTTCMRRMVNSNIDLIPDDSELSGELINKAPLLYAILNGAMRPFIFRKSFNMIPQFRTVLGVMLNAKNCKVNLFQKSVGLSLFFGKASIRTFSILNKLGISCSYRTTTRTLDSMVKTFDKKLQDFKSERSIQLQSALGLWKPEPPQNGGNEQFFMDVSEENISVTEEQPVGDQESFLNENIMQVDIPETPRRCGLRSRRRLTYDSEELPAAEGMYYGGMLTVDNINHVPQTLHYNSEFKPKVINMSSVAFIFNRIPQHIMEVVGQQKITNAADVDMSAYIPTTEDMKMIREDHKIQIKRILVKHLPYFNSIQNDPSIIWYLPHQFTELSKGKSETINLGIIDADGATTEGTKKVIRFAKQYFPLLDGNKVLPTVVGGDALTCDLIRSTLFHMSNSDTEEEKLEGPNPAVGQFHLRFCIISDIIKLFMGEKCSRPGTSTLPSLRAIFGHPEKMNDVKKNFHLATRFMDFVLAAYLVSYAMQVLNIKPDDYQSVDPDTPSEKKVADLDLVVQKIMEFQWLDISRNTSQMRFCVCQEIFDSKDKREYIACDNNRCMFEFWYHKDCLRQQSNTSYRKPPARTSSEYCCRKECQEEINDKKVMYTKSFMNAWLNFSGYRDSIRCNDGNRMGAYNKLHLIQFFNQKHHKYFRVCHMWQAQKAGWAAPNVAFDLLHNSTVNMSGKANSNFELDLFHEFLNRYLKSLMLVQFGTMSKANIVLRSRSYEILKNLREDWEKLLRNIDEEDSEHHKRYTKWASDIQAASKILLKEDVFRPCKGKRAFRGFQKFNYKHCFVENITEYRDQLTKFAKRLDDAQQYRSEVRESTKECGTETSI